MAITGLDAATFAVPTETASNSIDVTAHATGAQGAVGAKAQAPASVWVWSLIEVTVLIAFIWVLGGWVFRSANQG